MPDDAQRLLLFSRTTDYRHESIPVAVAALRGLPGVRADHSEDPAALHDLSPYDAVVFVSTSGDCLDDAARQGLRAYVEGGGGFAGVHSAAATEPSWGWYGELLGARFAGHPPDVQPGKLVVRAPDHPSCTPLPPRWAFTDEWYAFHEVRADLEVLLEVDESTYEPGGFAMGPGHPQAWQRRVGHGRSWFTALGHSVEAWADPLLLAHVRGGMASVVRDRPPTPPAIM